MMCIYENMLLQDHAKASPYQDAETTLQPLLAVDCASLCLGPGTLRLEHLHRCTGQIGRAHV